MAKSENLSDKDKCKIVEEEIRRFNELVGKHRELLMAIGKL